MTVTEQIDEATGLSNIMIMDSKKQTSTTSLIRPKAALVNGKYENVDDEGEIINIIVPNKGV